MRREYGSLLADLIDGPVNAKMRLQLMCQRVTPQFIVGSHVL